MRRDGLATSLVVAWGSNAANHDGPRRRWGKEESPQPRRLAPVLRVQGHADYTFSLNGLETAGVTA
jgi:hypothetical protein